MASYKELVYAPRSNTKVKDLHFANPDVRTSVLAHLADLSIVKEDENEEVEVELVNSDGKAYFM